MEDGENLYGIWKFDYVRPFIDFGDREGADLFVVFLFYWAVGLYIPGVDPDFLTDMVA